jgi:hypothetical protein
MFEREYGEKIDPRAYGYESLLAVFVSMTKTVVIKRHANSDHVVRLRTRKSIKS